MSIRRKYFSPSIAERRAYFPEGMSVLGTTLSTTSASYLNKAFLLPFFVRKPARNVEIHVPLTQNPGSSSGTNTNLAKIQLGIYSPIENGRILIGSQKIYSAEIALPATTTLSLQRNQTNLNLTPGWYFVAFLLKDNVINIRSYGSSTYRSIHGEIAFGSDNSLRDIALGMGSIDSTPTTLSSACAIQIAESSDNNYPPTNSNNNYISDLPNQVHNYVQRPIQNPLIYLVY